MTEEELRIELMRVKARETLFKHDAQEKIKDLEEKLQQQININQESEKRIEKISARFAQATKNLSKLTFEINEKNKLINNLKFKLAETIKSLELANRDKEILKNQYKEIIKKAEDKYSVDINEKNKLINNLKFQLSETSQSLDSLKRDIEKIDNQYKDHIKKAEDKYSFLANQLLAGPDNNDPSCSSIIDPERLTKYISIFNKSKKQFYEAIGIFKQEMVDDSILFLYNLKAKKKADYIEIYIKNIRKFYLSHPNLSNSDIIFLLEYIFEFCKIFNKNFAQYTLYYPAINSTLDINCKITKINGLMHVFSAAGRPDTMQLAEFNLLQTSATDPEYTSDYGNSLRTWFVDEKYFIGRQVSIAGILVPGLWDNDSYQFLVPPLLRGKR